MCSFPIFFRYQIDFSKPFLNPFLLQVGTLSNLFRVSIVGFRISIPAPWAGKTIEGCRLKERFKAAALKMEWKLAGKSEVDGVRAGQADRRADGRV